MPTLRKNKTKKLLIYKNPGDVINGIKIFIDFKYKPPILTRVSRAVTGTTNAYLNAGEIINKFKTLITRFAYILDKKFPSIKNRVPPIFLIDQHSNLNKELNLQTGSTESLKGIFFSNLNIIVIPTYLFSFKNYEGYFLRTLFHELGHFIFQKYLSEAAQDEIFEYVRKYSKSLSIEPLRRLANKYTDQEIKIKFPIIYVILYSLNLKTKKRYKNFAELLHHYIKSEQKDARLAGFDEEDIIENNIGNDLYTFTKPVSYYMPEKKFKLGKLTTIMQDPQEIFCEMFTNYMVYDKHMLDNSNYRLLKYLLPELR